MRDEADTVRAETMLPGDARLVVREQIAEQFARYRAEGADTAAYDECGRPMNGYYDELVDSDGRVRRMWSELSADFVESGTTGLGRLDSRVCRLIEHDGIYSTEVISPESPAMPTPWRLDPIPPRIGIEARGWQWVGQDPAQFSVAPAVQGYGGLASAPVAMRLFSLARTTGTIAPANVISGRSTQIALLEPNIAAAYTHATGADSNAVAAVESSAADISSGDDVTRLRADRIPLLPRRI